LVLPDLIPNIEILNKNGLYLNMEIHFTPKAIVGFIFRVTFRLISFSTNIEFLADILTNTLEVLHREIKRLFLFPFLLAVVRREAFVPERQEFDTCNKAFTVLLRFWDVLNY
jgi:hypothetical protein